MFSCTRNYGPQLLATFSHDGALLLTPGTSCLLLVWSAWTGHCLRIVRQGNAEGFVAGLAMTPGLHPGLSDFHKNSYYRRHKRHKSQNLGVNLAVELSALNHPSFDATWPGVVKMEQSNFHLNVTS
ncbi:unnamed protein product, partial [Protopolystoma xenopodis]